MTNHNPSGNRKSRFNKCTGTESEFRSFEVKQSREVKRWKTFRKLFRGAKYRQSWLNITIPLFLLTLFSLVCFYNPDTFWLGRRNIASCDDDAPTSDGGSSFPEDIFTKEQRQQGLLALHCICILYMFIGLSIICDDYFEPILEIICEQLDLSTDVAGATFMAAGGSAPELFTSIFGVFIATNDIGFGTIVGSAVFNVLFVIAICSWIAPGLKLGWYPLTRDCAFYCASIIILVACVIDQQIFWYEALMLLSCYGLYVFLMKHNNDVYTYVQRELEKPEPWTCSRRFCRYIVELTVFRVLVYGVILANLTFLILENSGNGDPALWDKLNYVCSAVYITEFAMKMYGLGAFRFWQDAWNALDGVLVLLVGVEFLVSSSGGRMSAMKSFRLARFMSFLRSFRVMRLLEPHHAVPHHDRATQTKEREFWESYDMDERSQQSLSHTGELEAFASNKGVQILRPARLGNKEKEDVSYADVLSTAQSGPRPSKKQSTSVRVSRSTGHQLEEVAVDESESSDASDGGAEPLFAIPDTTNGVMWWIITFPLRAFFQIIPNCLEEGKKSRWPLSFIMCIVCIAILTYVMVWMATIFGETVGIPDPVMGLTLLAGGTSIPDLLSSAAVARKGYGDMAVSSSIGSNIFDILVGLPLPWLVYGIAYKSPVFIKSDGMVVMVISLFIMVAFVCLSIHYCDWELKPKLGYIFVALYCLFVGESLLLEYGIILSSC